MERTDELMKVRCDRGPFSVTLTEIELCGEKMMAYSQFCYMKDDKLVTKGIGQRVGIFSSKKMAKKVLLDLGYKEISDFHFIRPLED